MVARRYLENVRMIYEVLVDTHILATGGGAGGKIDEHGTRLAVCFTIALHVRPRPGVRNHKLRKHGSDLITDTRAVAGAFEGCHCRRGRIRLRKAPRSASTEWLELGLGAPACDWNDPVAAIRSAGNGILCASIHARLVQR